jgi:FKBP-type peptidyl-prolyl cis-trans isomerase
LAAGELDAQQALTLNFTTPESGAVGEIDVEFILSIGAGCFAIDEELFDASSSLAPDAYVTTSSGLQYALIEAGEGPRPATNDTVRVHYVGTLEDGTVFDSSYARGESAVFGVGQLIDGFSEALQLMNEGATLIVRIPPELGYGSSRVGAIPANSTLLFEITLLDIL